MEVLSDTTHTAKRNHRTGCWVCGRVFKKGQWFHKQVNKTDGINTIKSCRRCHRWFLRVLEHCCDLEVYADWVQEHRECSLIASWKDRHKSTAKE
jgi:hypothetical protein